MISKNKIKELQKLHRLKYRRLTKQFIVEGPKMVLDLATEGVMPKELFGVSDWLTDHAAIFQDVSTYIISEPDLQKVSALKTANKLIAVYDCFKSDSAWLKSPDHWFVVLDGVQDPGNLGTIIRLCDWFGVTHIVCSDDTVDQYNSKVVQATMASIARVQMHYVDLPATLKDLSTKIPLFVADMDGVSIYEATFPEVGALIMGNEGNGVSEQICEIANAQLSIPLMHPESGIESLNVATATGIILSHIKKP